MIKNLLFFIVMLGIVCSLSCKSNHNSPSDKRAAGKFNFGILRYDSAALEYRLDSIHNRGLVMQFVIRESSDNESAFQLIAYAYDTLNDHNNSWMPDTLQVIGDSIPKTFTGRVTVGNNEVTREQLYDVVRDSGGKRFAYDYVMFIPTVEGVFNHLVYMMQPIKDNKPANNGKKQMTSPMPPARNWH